MDTVLHICAGFAVSCGFPADASRSRFLRLLFTASFAGVLPGCRRILIGPPAAAGLVGAFVMIVSAENPFQRFGILKTLIDDGGRVGISENVVFKPFFLRQNVIDNPTEERDVRAGTNPHKPIRSCARPAKSGIVMDDSRAAFSCFHRPAKPDRMGFRHIRPHDQNAIAVFQVLLVICRCPAAKRGAQTGHRCGVSNTRLVFDVNDTESSPKQFLDEIVFFVIQRCAAQ